MNHPRAFSSLLTQLAWVRSRRKSQSFTLELAEEPQGIELLSFHSANNVTSNTVESK